MGFCIGGGVSGGIFWWSGWLDFARQRWREVNARLRGNCWTDCRFQIRRNPRPVPSATL